ncbi:glycosyltransferase WbsX family protein [Bifidobacterium xylocopae]|uniref:Glycosyl transferase n=1 Tax=Bifidobacterium xylocopae TaxID=2493119 RepID=A0A366KDA5_9BIFI|nr:glycoside hydrolase family 99-like domain-containing protein [Bifidobacterium xylocopae]RBP99700.1 glycosyl transferase [Bifidobacterium xylocopae]
MKALALYLPAFHEIPENNQWWGDGFTEWDNVKSGKSYYQGHVQPVEPIQNDYYDLSHSADIVKQIKLAQSYSISGFIMYHYWFSQDKQLFTKPAKLLRNQIKEKIEYAFCWANESWITTWHGKDPNTLIEQTYGPASEWRSHIEYLHTFFEDERYIKINGHPLLFIYKPNNIPDYENMLDFWNTVLAKKGMESVYAVEFISSKNRTLFSQKTNAVVEFEPLYTTYFDLPLVKTAKRAFAKLTKQIDFQDYDILWRKILQRQRTYSGKPIFKSCFVSWDNSPRKEKNSMIVKGATAAKFQSYLSQLVSSDRPYTRDDYLIINAWNEWSEGAFLEPSKQYGYDYLQAVKNAL